MELFPSIISRAKTVQVITSGVSGHANGSLHLVIRHSIPKTDIRKIIYLTIYILFLQMYAELQVLSPLIPTRETHFLRYCQQNVDEGTWAIVDFPIDSFHDNLQVSVPRYRRSPSGCIIQDMPNGYSRVCFFCINLIPSSFKTNTMSAKLGAGRKNT